MVAIDETNFKEILANWKFTDVQITSIKQVLSHWISAQHMTKDQFLASLKALNTASTARFDSQCELKMTCIKLRTGHEDWTVNDVKIHNFKHTDLRDIAELESNAATPLTPQTSTPFFRTPSLNIVPLSHNVKQEDVQLSSFMKEINVSCDSLENFKIFYESLCTHGKNCNIHIRSYDNIDPSHLSEPNFNNNVKDCMRSCIHSILSKDNVFHNNFKEGRIALKMTTNGCNVLDILLGKTHSKLQCK